MIRVFRFLKQPFCNHFFIHSGTIHSIREGDDNYVYEHYHTECKKCGAYYITRKLHHIEWNYYKKK